jgi:hypothetical protein
MGSVDEDQSLVDPASAPIETPVDLSTKRNPCGLIHNSPGSYPLPGDFFLLAAARRRGQSKNWTLALSCVTTAARRIAVNIARLPELSGAPLG